MHKTLEAASHFDTFELPKLGGGTLTVGAPSAPYDWQMIVVYRGKHCPICKTYLGELQSQLSAFHDKGVEVIAISTDPEEKTKSFIDEIGLEAPVGYDLSPDRAAALGLYVSDPRSPQETDRPFAEPGLFVINGEGKLQIVDISNAPFARPELAGVAKGIGFIREKDYPIRGTHAA
jgi:peroxiredoxin